MTQPEQRQIRKLLDLADAAADFEHVDINLVTHFHVMRETLGLAKLLLLIQDYVRAKVQGKLDTEIPKISEQNQERNCVQ
jgi:hypothetical protein